MRGAGVHSTVCDYLFASVYHTHDATHSACRCTRCRDKVQELLGWEGQEAEDYVVPSKGGNCPEVAEVRLSLLIAYTGLISGHIQVQYIAYKHTWLLL